MRYHIMFSDKLLLKNGDTVSFDDVALFEPAHEYDVGTREMYGRKQGDNDNEYLEDFMSENFVVILEHGKSVYRFGVQRESDK